MNINDCVGSVKEYFVEKTCYLHIIRFSLACCGKIVPDERGGSGLALTIICLILGLTILPLSFVLSLRVWTIPQL